MKQSIKKDKNTGLRGHLIFLDPMCSKRKKEKMEKIVSFPFGERTLFYPDIVLAKTLSTLVLLRPMAKCEAEWPGRGHSF